MSTENTIAEIQNHWNNNGFVAPNEWPEGQWQHDWVWTEEGDGMAGEAEHGIFAIETSYESRFFIKPVAPSFAESKRRARTLRNQAVWS